MGALSFNLIFIIFFGERVMNADKFRSAWGNFATGVSLVTTTEGDGSVHGMTANGIASISLEPMLSMVSVGHKAVSYTHLRAHET